MAWLAWKNGDEICNGGYVSQRKYMQLLTESKNSSCTQRIVVPKQKHCSAIGRVRDSALPCRPRKPSGSGSSSDRVPPDHYSEIFLFVFGMCKTGACVH